MPDSESNDYRPRRSSGRVRRRRHPVRNTLIVVAALLVLALVAVGVYVGLIATTFNDQRQTVDAGIGTEAAAEDGAMNILVMGSDSRGEGQDTAENKGEDGERADTLMVVHVPEDRENVYVMSVVRDLWVEIPGHGERKVNAALSLGGYPLVTATVEELLDIKVDHLASIDFEGFRGLTDALGGVEVCNPNAFSSGQTNPSYYARGEILLNGTDALRYVRERKAFLGGDFERVANQQRFVSAMVGQLLSVDVLANPQRLMPVIESIVPFITVDDRLDAQTIAGYGLQLNGIRGGDIETFTIPHGEPAEGPGGASIVLQDEEGMERLRQAFRADDLGAYLNGDDGGSGTEGTEPPGEGAGASASDGAVPSDGPADPLESSTDAATGGAEDPSTQTSTDPASDASGSPSGVPSAGTPSSSAMPVTACGGD